jgi:hypothetical protein
MLRRAFVAAFATLSTAAVAQGLGLAERRALAAFQADRWPAIEASIHRAAGFPVPIQVEWEQIALPGQADRYGRPEYYGNTIFDPLIAALTDVTKDAMGKDALRAKLTRIVVRYDRATAPLSNYPNGVAFADGVLSINWEPGVNIHDQRPRTAALVSLLERNL